LVVALEEAAEEKSVDVQGLSVGGEAGIEVGGVGFDEEGKRRGIGVGGVGAACEEKRSKEVKK
jgi:hypothetical protein